MAKGHVSLEDAALLDQLVPWREVTHNPRIPNGGILQAAFLPGMRTRLLPHGRNSGRTGKNLGAVGPRVEVTQRVPDPDCVSVIFTEDSCQDTCRILQQQLGFLRQVQAQGCQGHEQVTFRALRQQATGMRLAPGDD